MTSSGIGRLRAVPAVLCRVAGRNRARMRRVLASLPPGAPWHAEAARTMSLVLRRLPPRARSRWLLSPGVRGWLATAEEAAALLSPAGVEELFETVAAGSHLPELLPRGRADRGFRPRAARLGRELRDRAFRALVPLLAHPAAGDAPGPFPLHLQPDGDEARARGEVHLWHPIPCAFFAAPGARLGIAGGAPILIPGGPVRPAPRPLIPGSTIVLARGVRSARTGLAPAGTVRGAADRLGQALRIVRRVWPEGAVEVEAYTRVVVPLSERGTVSFSMRARPAVSYINLRGKSPTDLADDLLHETAHHRLHALEELGPLTRDAGEPGFVSPWRRGPRPLRALLHAAYTFSDRAELLRRLLSGGGAPGASRAWIEKELRHERAAIRTALEGLARAGEERLLTRRGSALARGIVRRALR